MKGYLLFSTTWILLLAFIFCKVALSALPYSPISPGFNEKAGWMSFVPQGWGFFTRNPREPDILVFQRNNHCWSKLNTMPISNPNNILGLNRKPRAQSVELAMIMASVKDANWRNALINKNAFTIPVGTPFVITTTKKYATLTDTICIVQQQPVPWAWSWHRNKISLPSKYIVLYVQSR